jgi:Spy/CpxP family protein refolding chaperone
MKRTIIAALAVPFAALAVALAPTAAQASVQPGGPIILANPCHGHPHGHAWGHRRHHHHGCVQPGGPIIPASIIGDAAPRSIIGD